VFWFYYLKYSRVVDEPMRRPIFNEPAQIYAAGERVDVGEPVTPAAVVTELRAASQGDPGLLPSGERSSVSVHACFDPTGCEGTLRSVAKN